MRCYQKYNDGDPVVVANCWSQAQRKLREAFDRDGSDIAAEGLRRVTELYTIEAEILGPALATSCLLATSRSTPIASGT